VGYRHKSRNFNSQHLLLKNSQAVSLAVVAAARIYNY
jgi:hypothetical protein